MGDRRGPSRVFVGKPEGNGPFGRPKHGWENNIKLDLKEIVQKCVDWTSASWNTLGLSRLYMIVDRWPFVEI